MWGEKDKVERSPTLSILEVIITEIWDMLYTKLLRDGSLNEQSPSSHKMMRNAFDYEY